MKQNCRRAVPAKAALLQLSFYPNRPNSASGMKQNVGHPNNLYLDSWKTPLD